MSMAAAPGFSSVDAIDVLMAKVSELAVLPHVVFKVLEISGSTDFPAHDMEQAILVDPGFTSRVLTIANSAFYALPRQVSSIREAITFLGFKAIRQLAMTVGVFDVFIGKNDSESLRRRQWWRHSVDTAVCARYIALRSGKVAPDDAYTCGLVHWIGKTLLDRFGSGEYRLAEQLMEHHAGILQAEQAVFGCDHMAVSVAAATRWGFPESLVDALDYLEPAEPSEPHAALRASVTVADLISQYAVEGSFDDESTERTLPPWALEALNIPAARTLELIEGGVAAIADAAKLTI